MLPFRFFALLLFFSQLGSCLADEKRDLAQSIFQRAFERSAVLHWTEMQPNRISAEFTFVGKDIEGSGTFIRDLVRPDLWRERAQAGDYVQFRVRKQGKLWNSESFEFMPMRVFQFTQALHPSMQPLNKNDTITEAFKTNVDGREVACVNLMAFGNSPYRHKHHFICIDSQTGVLALYQTEEFSISYSGFQAIGEWLMPTNIRIAEEGKPVAEGVLKIEPAPALIEEDFVQLPNAHEVPICKVYQEPWIRQDPQYWYTDSMRRTVHGRVTVWMKLDVKGRILKTYTAEVGNKDMNLLAVEGLHRSILEPARCDGKPVPSTHHETTFFQGSN